MEKLAKERVSKTQKVARTLILLSPFEFIFCYSLLPSKFESFNATSWISVRKHSSQNLKKPNENVNVRLMAVIKFNIKHTQRD